MKTIAIMGLGLMGSSLGFALKTRCPGVWVHAYARREETRTLALERDVADAVFDNPAEAVAGAELVVFCVPVLTIPVLAQACLPGLIPSTILTDVGSTKVELNFLMGKLLQGSDTLFIGSHPICGSEEQGMDAGIATLYEDALAVVTPQSEHPTVAIEKVSNLWKEVGANVTVMCAEEHDRILARTSHLPHVLAVALVQSMNSNGAFCGSGFRDTTRIAEGSPSVWRDILISNRVALKDALADYRTELEQLMQLLDENNPEKIKTWLANAVIKRKELLE